MVVRSEGGKFESVRQAIYIMNIYFRSTLYNLNIILKHRMIQDEEETETIHLPAVCRQILTGYARGEKQSD